MTAPSSCTLARHAVLTALTTATGKPQALTDLFRVASPADVAANPADFRAKPGAWVLFRDGRTDDQMVGGSLLTWIYTVDVVCSYYAGSDVLRAKIGGELDAYLTRIEADGPRVYAALTAPGALDSYGGSDTGLDGHALRPDGYRSVGPVQVGGAESETRVLRVTHSFIASLDLAQP